MLVNQNLTQFEKLSRKLDTAEKKINEYAQLIASLCAELKRHQDVICQPCREKIFLASLATAPSSNSSGFSEPASRPIASASPLLSEPSFAPGHTSGGPSAAGPPLASAPSLTAHDQPQVHSLGGSRLVIAAPDPDIPRATIGTTMDSLPTCTVSSYSADDASTTLRWASHSAKDPGPPQPTVPSSSTSENAKIAGPSTQPGWSVEYNTTIKQTISLHVANTFTFKAAVNCTKFSLDGKYLALGLQNGETHIHNMLTGSKRILVERSPTVFYTNSTKSPSSIWAVRFSPDSKYVATGAGGGQINIWEIDRKRLRATFKHKDIVRSLDFSPDGRFLVSASFDNSVCMWRIRDGSRRTLWHESSRFMSVAFSPDGRSVAAGNDDGFVWICDAHTSRLVAKWSVANRGSFILKTMVFTPDGGGIATGDESLGCWDVSSLITRRSGGRHIIQDQMNQIWEFEGHNHSLTGVSFSSDNLWVVSSFFGGNVCVLEARTGCWLCTLKGHMGSSIWGADFSPAGHYIVSGGEDRRVQLWKYDLLE